MKLIWELIQIYFSRHDCTKMIKHEKFPFMFMPLCVFCLHQPVFKNYINLKSLNLMNHRFFDLANLYLRRS